MSILERFEEHMATGSTTATSALEFVVVELARLEARIAELESRPAVQRPEDIGITSGEL